MNISVGIVEDEMQISRAIAALINGSEGFSCIHVYENPEDAILNIPKMDLDVVLMDIHLPGK